MEVKYENQPADIQYIVRTRSTWALAEMFLTAPLMVLLAAAPACGMLLLSRYFVAGVLVIAGVIFSAGWLFWKVRQAIRSSKVIPGVIRLRITPAFLDVEHAEYRSRLSWLAIESVHHVDDALVILQPMGRGYIVRDSFFKSAEAAQQFFAAASQYHASTKAVDPTVSDRSSLPAWTGDSSRHSISYQNTIAQWTWALKTIGAANKTIFTYLYPILLCVGSNGILAYMTIGDFRQADGGRVPLDSTFELFLLMLLLLISIASSFATLMLLRELANRVRIPDIWLLPKTVDIYPQGLVSGTSVGTSAIRWPVLGAAYRQKELLCVDDQQGRPTVIVPASAFPDETAAEAFLADMTAWNDAAIEASASIDDTLIVAESVDDQNPYRSPQT
ncbi:hypothetical protein Enr8_27500 [Blastopirellula retiformator]|uniref:YcxB-like protein domain-containing protein n=2 Tax=Blastopirellula retiformator TaxID=2527970 RepID=A0A5C5V2U9_9BACT|nr:hypothetical protein Enr8_27500 [Blastopirellula retiformator]